MHQSYIKGALGRAHYEILEDDGSYYGTEAWSGGCLPDRVRCPELRTPRLGSASAIAAAVTGVDAGRADRVAAVTPRLGVAGRDLLLRAPSAVAAVADALDESGELEARVAQVPAVNGEVSRGMRCLPHMLWRAAT